MFLASTPSAGALVPRLMANTQINGYSFTANSTGNARIVLELGFKGSGIRQNSLVREFRRIHYEPALNGMLIKN